MRLDKYLSDALNISRIESKKIIKTKQVSINGSIITDTNCSINEIKDVVKVLDKEIKYQKYIYLMMNKPKGYLCATSDKSQQTVMELIPDDLMKKDLSIVGRLDKDTEGLLLLSNDGQFVHNLTSPKKHISKTYYVEFTGKLVENAISLVKEGLAIDNEYITLPSILEPIDENKAYITIYEGKFHQVKKMFEKLNTQVVYLKRIKIGSLELDNLEIGNVKELSEDDFLKLKD